MLMHRLLPGPAGDVDTLDAYALPDVQAPHLRVNMVTSVDGAATVEGRVGVLSGTADHTLLHELRALSDVLLVGAGTIRAEGYGPLRLTDEQKRRRAEAGLQEVPRLAVLTRSLDLDLTAPVFTQATARPLLVTAEQAPAARRAAAEQVAEVLVAGEHAVALRRALHALADLGLPRVLSEGGPRVLAEMFADDLVDELCLAVAPLVTLGDELRITAGPALPEARRLRLGHVLECEEFLFLRYTR
jgi:riboflavin biosynthesis pyrimidine reductase